jgi:hypothetical protein
MRTCFTPSAIRFRRLLAEADGDTEVVAAKRMDALQHVLDKGFQPRRHRLPYVLHFGRHEETGGLHGANLIPYAFFQIHSVCEGNDRFRHRQGGRS